MTHGQHRPKLAQTEHRPQNFDMVAVALDPARPVVWQITAIPGPRAPEFEVVFADGTAIPEIGDTIVLENTLIRAQHVEVAYVEPHTLELATESGFTVDIWNVYVHKAGA